MLELLWFDLFKITETMFMVVPVNQNRIILSSVHNLTFQVVNADYYSTTSYCFATDAGTDIEALSPRRQVWALWAHVLSTGV